MYFNPMRYSEGTVSPHMVRLFGSLDGNVVSLGAELNLTPWNTTRNYLDAVSLKWTDNSFTTYFRTRILYDMLPSGA